MRRLITAGFFFVLALVSCRSTSSTSTAQQVGSWLLEVESTGPYWLGPAWFQSHGLPLPHTVEQVNLSLDREPIPYLMLQGPDGMGLFFYAEFAPTRYASWSTYRLDMDQGAGRVMEVALAPANGAETPANTSPPAQDAFWFTRWLEEDLLYLPQIEAPLPWSWELVPPGGQFSQTVALTGCVAGPVTVTVRLLSQGATSAQTSAPYILWNGERIGTWQWDGPTEQSWQASLAGSSPCDENILTLEMPAGQQAAPNKVWLDGWGVTYRQLFREMDVTWLAEAEKAVIPGPPDRRLLDVSVAAAPVDLGLIPGMNVHTQPGHRYWLGNPWQAPTPVRSRPLAEVDQAVLEQAEYLILAAEPFWQALDPLVDYRQRQGLRVLRLTPCQVYDTFGDGRPGPEAIRGMVNQLHAQGHLRYLLLVGDGSIQPDGYVATGEGELRVVTALLPTARLHETPSDQALVANDQGQALVPVGRFPAQTVAQVEVMVDKSIRWEEHGLGATLVLADDQPDLVLFAGEISAWLPIEPQRLEVGKNDPRASTLAVLSERGVWLNYIGHGSLTFWGDEKLLQREDHWSQPAVVTVWTCLSGYFVHPEQDSLAEAWLASAQGGAVAFVAPTGETYLDQQRPMAEAFYAAIQAGQTLGDALLAGWPAASRLKTPSAASCCWVIPR